MYPHIAKLARKYLVTLSSSVTSELLFSQAGLMMATSKGNRRSGKTATAIMFLHGSIKYVVFYCDDFGGVLSYREPGLGRLLVGRVKFGGTP